MLGRTQDVFARQQPMLLCNQKKVQRLRREFMKSRDQFQKNIWIAKLKFFCKMWNTSDMKSCL